MPNLATRASVNLSLPSAPWQLALSHTVCHLLARSYCSLAGLSLGRRFQDNCLMNVTRLRYLVDDVNETKSQLTLSKCHPVEALYCLTWATAPAANIREMRWHAPLCHPNEPNKCFHPGMPGTTFGQSRRSVQGPDADHRRAGLLLAAELRYVIV